jgi:hypothetical protein
MIKLQCMRVIICCTLKDRSLIRGKLEWNLVLQKVTSFAYTVAKNFLSLQNSVLLAAKNFNAATSLL